MKIKRFTGLDEVNEPIDVGLGGLVIAKNVDLNRRGLPETRTGYARITTESIKAAWDNGTVSLYLLTDGTLKLINADGTIVSVATDIPGSQLTGAMIGSTIYYSTDLYNGVIENNAHRKLGVDAPTFTYSVGTGALREGTYLVAVSQVEDGRESETVQTLVEVDDYSSITITPTLESGNSAYFYVSLKDGEEMFFLGEGTSFVLNSETQLINTDEPVTRQFMNKMLFADVMEEHRGYLLAGVGNTFVHSNANDYEYYHRLLNVYEFDSDITMIHSVEGGVFLSTKTEILFATGEVVEDFNFVHVYRDPAKKGTDKTTLNTDVGELTGSGKGVMFTTVGGSICYGAPDGSIINITRDKLAIDSAGEMTAYVDRHKYVAVKNS